MKSLKTLIALCVPLFTEDKNLKKVFASEDGNVFIDENRANLHKTETKSEYHTILRKDAVTDEDGEGEISKKNTSEDEAKKAELIEEYKMLFDGKAPHHMIGIEKLETLITEKKAENAKAND